MEGGWLTTGPKVTEFEQAFARACGHQDTSPVYAVAVSSATAGLHLALLADNGISEHCRVAVPTWTFSASAAAIEMAGCTPVICDIDPYTLFLTDQSWEKHQNSPPYLAGFMPVHMAGLRCKSPYGNSRSVIEDAAHMLPYDPGQGRTAVFSFYATKPIACGEGGMVVTRDEYIADRVRGLRCHGFGDEVFDRHQTGHRTHEVVRAGFKYNMPDLMAAIGLVQLNRSEDMLAQRRYLAYRYREHLRGCMLPPCGNESEHLFIIRVPAALPFIERMRKDYGIACGLHYKPLHQHKYWREKYSLLARDFPNAEAASKNAVSLPIYAGLSEADQDRIIKAVEEILC